MPLALRARSVRQRHSQYLPKETRLHSSRLPARWPRSAFPLLHLPVELFDRIVHLLPSASKLRLAYASHATYDRVIPALYRTIDLTSAGQIDDLFGAPDSISQLILVSLHTRTLNLNLAIDSRASKIIHSTAQLFPRDKLCTKPITLHLSQKARWSLIGYPQNAAALACFSEQVTLHVKWSGPCKLPGHFHRLFENLGTVAATAARNARHRDGKGEARLLLHLRENEFAHMPPSIFEHHGMPPGSSTSLLVYVHPSRGRRNPPGRQLSVGELVLGIAALIVAMRSARNDRTASAETKASVGRSTSNPYALAFATNSRSTRRKAAIIWSKPLFHLEIVLIGRSRHEVADANELVRAQVDTRASGHSWQTTSSAPSADYTQPVGFTNAPGVSSESDVSESDFAIRGTGSDHGGCEVCGA